MRIRLEDPAHVVVDDRVVERVGGHELEAGLVGSYSDGGQSELERLIEEWLDRRHEQKAPLRIIG